MFQNIFSHKMPDIKKDDLVLEIGSGSNPLYRSDVLLDKYPLPNDIHRTSLRTVYFDERPFVIGDAHSLPFIDKSFDFVIARHVLEHLNEPEKFISEIKRVSNSAYITTPSPFTELVHGGYQNIDQNIDTKCLHHGKGTPGHKWFVLNNNHKIYMVSKSPDLYKIYLLFGYFIKNNTKYTRDLFFRKNPEWRETKIIIDKSDDIELVVINEIEKMEIDEINIEKVINDLSKINFGLSFQQKIKSLIKQIVSRNKVFDLYQILACPICKRTLKKKGDSLECSNCGKYPIANNVPVLLKESLNL